VVVPKLTDGEVTSAIEKRLGRDSACYAAVTGNQVLLGFARKPFLLEIMCTIRADRWRSLWNAQTPARLYDAWFDEVIAASTNPVETEHIDETRIAVGKIAAEMLRNRSDLISESSLQKAPVKPSYLQMLTRTPFGIFIKETQTEWGFVHASFRDFALAKTAATELISRRYDLLAETVSFDYVGAETYRFLRDLIPDDDRLLEVLEHAVNTTAEPHDAWNNIVHNAFEAIGMIGEESSERFIDTALKILRPRAEADGNHRVVFTSTKWNIVRCLERLHRSAPRPPNFMWFGAVAVRGFHMQHKEPGYFPPMQYLVDMNGSDNPMQRDVSDCLLSVLENLGVRAAGDESVFLEVNCTHALIRWLHGLDVDRAKALLRKGELSADSKGESVPGLPSLQEAGHIRGCEPVVRWHDFVVVLHLAIDASGGFRVPQRDLSEAPSV
jgi:hypothetical protein